MSMIRTRRLLFGYFFLATQEKVTSCRATPGGFVFDWIPAFAGMTTTLQIQQHPPRIFQRFLDGDEELHRFAAVDDAMVVG